MKYFQHEQLVKEVVNGGTSVMTPEGLQAFKTAATGVHIYKNAKSVNPEFHASTGYGASYVAKVQSGTPRMTEYMAVTPLKQGGEFTVFFTSATTPTKAEVETLYYEALNSLPTSFKKLVKSKAKGIEVMLSKFEIGLL